MNQIPSPEPVPVQKVSPRCGLNQPYDNILYKMYQGPGILVIVCWDIRGNHLDMVKYFFLKDEILNF